MRRSTTYRHAAMLGLALTTVMGLAVPARAQHTPDPYNIVGEYNLGYEDFMYPAYPNAAGFSPNQGILMGRAGYRRANQFENYLQDLEGTGRGADSLFGSTGRSRSGFGEPYYRAHRQFDEAFDRIYTPNAASDQTYYQDQEARTKKYLEYLKESDPKKRAQLFREYKQQGLQAARDFGVGSSRAAYRRSTLAREAAISRTTPPATTPAPSGPAASSAPGLTSPYSPPLTVPRGGITRRPSRSPIAPGRTRPGLESSRPSDTPEEILERASRSISPPPSSPSSGAAEAPR